MTRSVKFFFLVALLLFLTTYKSSNDKGKKSYFFKVKKIIIENTVVIDSSKLKKNLEYLEGKSLLSINSNNILNQIHNNEFISNIKIKKIYPNTLKVYIYEKKPVALQILAKEKFYLTDKNEKLQHIEVKKYSNLPIIFGNQKNFDLFLKEIKNHKFPEDQIKAFYYFDIGRWDIILKNGKTIKLPEKNYLEALTNLNDIIYNDNFKKYSIFDYRIKDQLILE